MITPVKEPGVVRVTVTLDPEDVDLLDRLARLEGKNRSSELREMLRAARPTVRQMVEMMEAALRKRDEFTKVAVSGLVSDLEVLMPEISRLNDQFTGAMSRVEGAIAAADESEPDAADPRRSNHGGHTPTPTTPPAPDEGD